MIMNMAALALALLAGAVGQQTAPPEMPSAARRFVGAWISEYAGFTNVTVMSEDGRFRTERTAGIEHVTTITGRWELRGNSLAWYYDRVKDLKEPEDVNPILYEAPDRMRLREVSGSESVLFRMGVLDPKAPARLPVAVGIGWLLQDEGGELLIRITARERMGGRDCYRVDWITEDQAYQSEFWSVEDEGIRVHGRRILGQTFEFRTPYTLLKPTLADGDTWRGSVTLLGRTEEVSMTVGREDAVSTPAGTFRAVPVTVKTPALHYVRWYADKVGLVREDLMSGSERTSMKVLKRRLQ